MNRAWKVFAVCSAAALAPAGVTAAAATGDFRHGNIIPRAVIAAVHADVNAIDARGQSQRFAWDKGTVTARSDSSITIERKDGTKVTLAIDAGTKIRAKNGALNIAVVAFSREGKAYLVLAFQTRIGPPPARSSADPPTKSRWVEWSERVPDRLFDVPRRAVHVDWALIMADGKASPSRSTAARSRLRARPRSR